MLLIKMLVTVLLLNAVTLRADAGSTSKIFFAAGNMNASPTYGDVRAWHAEHRADAPVRIDGNNVYVPDPFEPMSQRTVVRFAPKDARAVLTDATRLYLVSLHQPYTWVGSDGRRTDTVVYNAELLAVHGPAHFPMGAREAISETSGSLAASEVTYQTRPAAPFRRVVADVMVYVGLAAMILAAIGVFGLYLPSIIAERWRSGSTDRSAAEDRLAAVADASEDALAAAQREFAMTVQQMQTVLTEILR